MSPLIHDRASLSVTSMSGESSTFMSCPVCCKNIARDLIEAHVDKCLFLNSRSDSKVVSPSTSNLEPHKHKQGLDSHCKALGNNQKRAKHYHQPLDTGNGSYCSKDGVRRPTAFCALF